MGDRQNNYGAYLRYAYDWERLSEWTGAARRDLEHNSTSDDWSQSDRTRELLDDCAAVLIQLTKRAAR